MAHTGDGLIIRERKEDNGEQQPTDSDAVHDSACQVVHVEISRVHVPPVGEEVGQDGDHIGHVVDRDSGAKHRVERRRGAEIQTAQGGNDGGDGQLRVQRHLPSLVDFCPAA